MHEAEPATFLLASAEPALLTAYKPVLAAGGARVEIVLSLEAALLTLTASPVPALAVIDVELPCMEPGMCMGRLLAAVCGGGSGAAISDRADGGDGDAGVDGPAGRRGG